MTRYVLPVLATSLIAWRAMPACADEDERASSASAEETLSEAGGDQKASGARDGWRSGRLHMLLRMPARTVGTVVAVPGNLFRHGRVRPVFEKRKLGRFVFSPTLSISERVSDNVFQIDRDEVGDWITTVSPGLKLEAPFGDGHSLFAQYMAHLVRPASHVAELSTEDHTLLLESELSLSDSLSLTLEDNLSRTTVPADDVGDRPDQFYYNEARAALEWEIGEKWRAEMAAGHEVTQFRTHETGIDDFHAPRTQYTLFYGLTSNVSLLVDHAYKHMFNDNDTRLNDVPEDTDNDNHTVSLGLELGEELPVHGRVQAGLSRKNFGDHREEDVHTWVFSADLTWDATDSLAVALAGSRSIEETTLSAANDNSGRTFISTALEASIEYELAKDWFLLAGASLIKDRYKQRGEFDNHRVDWLPAVSVGLAYQPAEWLRSEIRYEHYDNHSSADGESWRENTAAFSVSVGF